MKTFTLLIAVSLTANILLAGWWIKRRSVGPEVAIIVAKPTQAAANAPTLAEASPAASAVVTETPAQSAPASWKDIQTDDLKEMIRRLRAVGCPEDTIQDLILAEVNRRYQSRTRELWPERYKAQPFWQVQKRDPAENRRNRETWRKERELQKEKSALLVELLGVDPEKERRKEEGFDEPMHWMDSRVAFLPEAKREAALKYLEEFEDKMQDFYARNQGMWDAQSRVEQKQLEAEKLQGLAQFLTPQELREYELRQSQTANQLSHDLRTLSVTRDQYEAIFDIRKKYGDSIYNYGDIETKEARQKVEDNKTAMKAELATTLGPVMAKEFERSQDHSYQQLTRLAQRTDLPADTATKVYDYKEAAEQSVKQLQSDTSLTPEQRQTALQQIRVETETTVKTTLGDKNYKRYLREGGWWLNNIAPSPTPKPNP
jgi:hypothetical protein